MHRITLLFTIKIVQKKQKANSALLSEPTPDLQNLRFQDKGDRILLECRNNPFLLINLKIFPMSRDIKFNENQSIISIKVIYTLFRYSFLQLYWIILFSSSIYFPFLQTWYFIENRLITDFAKTILIQFNFF